MPEVHLPILQMRISQALSTQCESMMSVMEDLHDTKDVKELETVETLLEGFAEDVDFYKKLVEGKLITTPTPTSA